MDSPKPFCNDPRTLTAEMPLRRMRQQQQWIDDLVKNESEETSLEPPCPSQPAALPACDLHETSEHYSLSMDLPGLGRGDLRVELADTELRISGERRSEREDV